MLPVKQTTAQLNWPQNGVFASVEAPLIGYVATDLSITVPCSAAAGWQAPRPCCCRRCPSRRPGRRSRTAHRTR
ncbi:mycobacterial cell wall arabinan synthesis family protein [Mycobacterium xenopi 4042]|uniref:Mycobacterial cell wall arabinan synthesis family protein n=1 Tax=Mycobacterium xenopi 4042 TaxID=1299334 RepID=X8DID5_MYCXE|nr:mycobacterial cell wall arabinan synthesis family protein [Mycobacterium xenopi 4042]